jgi:predicted dithiol-disulfide oxidoreductase (DUF899 family)
VLDAVMEKRRVYHSAAIIEASGLQWRIELLVVGGVITYRREAPPRRERFALEDGVVYHAYSAYARRVDGLWGMYRWLDRAPLGRNETGSGTAATMSIPASNACG